MNAAFSGWTIPIVLQKVGQVVIEDGLVYENLESITVTGTWQPFGAKQLMLKPEGQRAWEWVDFHVRGSSMLFKVNDKVIRSGLPYKVMALFDYTLNNYSEYHLIRDYDAIPQPDNIPANYVTYNGVVVTYLGVPVTFTPPSNYVTFQGEVVTYLGQPVTTT